MGTKAVFAIKASDGKIYRTIIGMTSDGFPKNLEYLAEKFNEKASSLRVKTKVKKYNWPAIYQVLKAVVAEHDDWLFLDDLNNARWVSHSAVLDCNNNKIYHSAGRPTLGPVAIEKTLK